MKPSELANLAVEYYNRGEDIIISSDKFPYRFPAPWQNVLSVDENGLKTVVVKPKHVMVFLVKQTLAEFEIKDGVARVVSVQDYV